MKPKIIAYASYVQIGFGDSKDKKIVFLLNYKTSYDCYIDGYLDKIDCSEAELKNKMRNCHKWKIKYL